MIEKFVCVVFLILVAIAFLYVFNFASEFSSLAI